MTLGGLNFTASRPQRLERPLAVIYVDGHLAWSQSPLSGRPLPQKELDVLTLDADGQKSCSAGCRHVPPLLETDDVCVEIERLVLVADEHGYVRDVFQHRSPLMNVTRR